MGRAAHLRALSAHDLNCDTLLLGEMSATEHRGQSGDVSVRVAGGAPGEALAGPLRRHGARGHGSAVLPADEALAHVALEASGRPLVVSNVDLSDAHVAGLDRDLVSEFLRELAEAAGLTLHVRLLHGEDARHVLEAIFKALGGALAAAGAPRKE